MSRLTRLSKPRAILLVLSLFLIYSFHRQLILWLNAPSRSFVEQPLQAFNYEEYPFHPDDLSSPSFENIAEVEAPLPSSVQSPLCKSYECGKGKWTPRKDPFTSLEHFQSLHSNSFHPVWFACDLWNAEKQEAEDMERAGQRLVDMVNWEWLPDQGRVLDYDPIDFMVRMLKSPGGVIFVGDSLSRQHWHAFYVPFLHLNITYHSNPKHLPLAETPHVDQFVLMKDSPMYKILQERAGVPDSRMERPFFTILEDHMVVGEADIRTITNVEPDYEWPHKFRRVEGWEDHIKWLATPREGEEDSVTEDTLVLMNAGAHWSRQELPMLRASTEAEEKSLLTDAYGRMIDLVTARLSPLERTSIYYRSTSPGHPQCKDTGAPYKDIADAHAKEQGLVSRLQQQVSTAEEKQGRSRWDWDEFKHHNEMWNRTIHSMNEKRPVGSKGAKWYYFDVWDMSLQRPEAHLEPPNDCLHFCLPTIFDDWTKLFYHTVNVEEGRAK